MLRMSDLLGIVGEQVQMLANAINSCQWATWQTTGEEDKPQMNTDEGGSARDLSS
jgi:hypothetical protein